MVFVCPVSTRRTFKITSAMMENYLPTGLGSSVSLANKSLAEARDPTDSAAGAHPRTDETLHRIVSFECLSASLSASLEGKDLLEQWANMPKSFLGQLDRERRHIVLQCKNTSSQPKESFM
jgi:hypothetical protein